MAEAVGFALIAVGIFVLVVLGLRQPRRASPLKLKPPPLPPEEGMNFVLNELERVRLAEKAKAESDEKTRRWLRPFGVFGRLVTYVVAFLARFTSIGRRISRTRRSLV